MNDYLARIARRRDDAHGLAGHGGLGTLVQRSQARIIQGIDLPLTALDKTRQASGLRIEDRPVLGGIAGVQGAAQPAVREELVIMQGAQPFRIRPARRRIDDQDRAFAAPRPGQEWRDRMRALRYRPRQRGFPAPAGAHLDAELFGIIAVDRPRDRLARGGEQPVVDIGMLAVDIAAAVIDTLAEAGLRIKAPQIGPFGGLPVDRLAAQFEKGASQLRLAVTRHHLRHTQRQVGVFTQVFAQVDAGGLCHVDRGDGVLRAHAEINAPRHIHYRQRCPTHDIGGGVPLHIGLAAAAGHGDIEDRYIFARQAVGAGR